MWVKLNLARLCVNTHICRYMAATSVIKKIILFFRLLEEIPLLVKNYLAPRRFILFAGIIVSLFSATAAVSLKWMAHKIHTFLFYTDFLPYQQFAFIFLPILGLLLTVMLGKRLFGRMPEGGIGRVLTAISLAGSNLNSVLQYAHILGAALTVGFGGSCGLESPIVTTGSAIGSNFGKRYNLTYREKTLLIACGVSAGISAAFNAPVAGVLFSIEVLLADVAISAFIPLLLSAGTGVILSNILLGTDILLYFPDTLKFNYINTPFYIILGVIIGFYSHFYAIMFKFSERSLGKFSNVWQRTLTGGLMLAILFAIFPPLFGEGYDSIKKLVDGNPSILMSKSVIAFPQGNYILMGLFLIGVLAIKPFATGITLGAGGIGGNFAPSMFSGGLTGYLFTKAANLIPGISLPVENFTLTGMAAMLSCIFRSPLTAIFLVQEISAGYTLIIPLMLTVAAGYAVSSYFKPYAMELSHLAAKGKIFTEDRDRNALFSVSAVSLAKNPEFFIRPGQTVADAQELLYKQPNADLIPLISSDGRYLGAFTLPMFNQKPATEMMAGIEPNVHEYADEKFTGKQLMELYEKHTLNAIPCLRNGKYIGMVYKIQVLEAYRRFIQSTSMKI